MTDYDVGGGMTRMRLPRDTGLRFNPIGRTPDSFSPATLLSNVTSILSNPPTFNPPPPYVESVLSAVLPSSIRVSTQVIDTQYSTEDANANSNDNVLQTIVAKPYPDGLGWERNFRQSTPLFCARGEEQRVTRGTYTVADLPILNYLLEYRSVLDAAQALQGVKPLQATYDGSKQVPPSPSPQGSGHSSDLLRGTAFGELGADDLEARFGVFMARTAEEMRDKWNYLGCMTSDGGIPGDVNVHNARTLLLSYSNFKRNRLDNHFGAVRKGTQVYYVAKCVENVRREFLDPTGQVVRGRADFPSQFLQVFGINDHHSYYPLHNTTMYGADVRHDGAQYNDDTPLLSRETDKIDRDYIYRSQRVAQYHSEVDWDETTDTFFFRNVAAQEGMQEAVASAPQIVFDAYHWGETYFVGTVTEKPLGGDPSEQHVFDALRSQPLSIQLPKVVVVGGM